MKKLTALFVVVLMSVSFFAGCTQNNSAAETESPAVEENDNLVKVVLLTSSGGLGDRSFNDAAYKGLKRAEEELGAEIKVIEPQSSADYLQSLKTAASLGYDLVMTVGNDWADALETVMPNYPDIKFGGVNLKTEADNLAVAKFSDHEGSYLAGALAAQMTESGTIGVIGGMDIPAIKRFVIGFEEGAKYANPDVVIIPTYVGSFADPNKGKEFALQLINEGADVIYHVAGKTGEGLFAAVKENEEVYAIGVDQDQDYIVEGKILTSMIKRVDVAVFDFAKQVKEGNYSSGIHVYGVAENGVSLSEMTYTKELISTEILDSIETIRQEIIDGTIEVTDLFEQ
ncbi:BMP family ABC transporter substrate-binding protein [Gottschalkiaceae bacterium SANA]|nr:BMP family ABC transporter substrate-binding protein [Gottschalkiaceae bacterium SANA]